MLVAQLLRNQHNRHLWIWLIPWSAPRPLDKQELIGNAPPPGEPVYSGQTSPGARVPFSSIEAAPVNDNIAFTFPNGVPTPYYYTNPTMLGFTGGGGATYGGRAEPVFSPVVGDWSMPPAYRQSYYDKKREKASPGYYSVYLDTFQTQVELTATRWASMMRFTFPATDSANVLVNFPEHGGQMEAVGDHTVRGLAQDSRAVDGAYFVAEFSTPFSSFGSFHKAANANKGWGIGDKEIAPGERHTEGTLAGVYLTFRSTGSEPVLMKVAHGTSYLQAEQRLHDEMPDWNFELVHKTARDQWAQLLDLVQITGGTPEQRAMFYSTLFQSFASPRLIAARGEPFTDTNGKVQTAAHDRYSPVPFWDTGRNQIVLLELLDPERMRNIMASEFDMAREKGYMNTSFHGDNAVFMFLGLLETRHSF